MQNKAKLRDKKFNILNKTKKNSPKKKFKKKNFI